MFIGSDDNLRKIRDVPHLHLGDTTMKRVHSSKSVGVYIDERLSWDAHIDYISKRVSSAIGGLRQVRTLVPFDTALTIYNSLIQPIFDYCDVVWDNLSSTSAQRLQKLQNRAARVITQQGYDVRSNDLRKELGWDTLEQRRYKHKAIMMHKTLNSLAPKYLEELFKPSHSSSNYHLRKVSLALPMPRTEFLKKSFKYSGAKLWNNLPDNIKHDKSLAAFKRKLSSSLSR